MHRQQKQTLAIVAAATIFVLTPFFVNVSCSAPAIWVEKHVRYDINNQYWQYPPVVGMEIDFWQGEKDRFLWEAYTDKQGMAYFGSGIPDGTYTLNYTYGGQEYVDKVSINCSKLCWHIDNVVPAKDA
jgi:hypothetical protein